MELLDRDHVMIGRFPDLNLQLRSWSESFNPAVLFQTRQAEGGCFVKGFGIDFDGMGDSRRTSKTYRAGSQRHGGLG